ncbi:hypothetical protein DFP72DRAFT_1062171 [Ephemerocybe angulata]|uniref:Nephrocystin 3-like N-terminal domain-containing protein n=1 Tax=Ephemerocybe angulata TaxID=980116 RepID=A0A8H6I905_9AGAR|nr:hypothetical protein DFP72DRAFT_1062171 [Tulosesus angulatus]
MCPGWKLLVEKTAPNALHNSDARYDPPKCDEDTRMEVTSEIMGWIQDFNAPQRLLCMTGAAGAGKSALQQTIAERCAGLGILAVSFFFNASDHTRSHTSALVPTIAYQLGRSSQTLRHRIASVVEEDPLIFSQSLETQTRKLVVEPIVRLSPPDFASLPYAILIDGLDECSGEDRQRELLVVIQRCLLNARTPFRVFLASRPEIAIYEALQQGGHLNEAAYHIRLSDDYDASLDIRRTIQRRLRDIGLRRGLVATWYSKKDVEALTESASGQYIHAATVIRYISDPRGSPVNRLRTVLTWRSRNNQKDNPFCSLDVLYNNILLKAKEAYEAANPNQAEFVVIVMAYLEIANWGLRLGTQDKLLGLEDGAPLWNLFPGILPGHTWTHLDNPWICRVCYLAPGISRCGLSRSGIGGIRCPEFGWDHLTFALAPSLRQCRQGRVPAKALHPNAIVSPASPNHNNGGAYITRLHSVSEKRDILKPTCGLWRTSMKGIGGQKLFRMVRRCVQSAPSSSSPAQRHGIRLGDSRRLAKLQRLKEKYESFLSQQPTGSDKASTRPKHKPSSRIVQSESDLLLSRIYCCTPVVIA